MQYTLCLYQLKDNKNGISRLLSLHKLIHTPLPGSAVPPWIGEFDNATARADLDVGQRVRSNNDGLSVNEEGGEKVGDDPERSTTIGLVLIHVDLVHDAQRVIADLSKSHHEAKGDKTTLATTK